MTADEILQPLAASLFSLDLDESRHIKMLTKAHQVTVMALFNLREEKGCFIDTVSAEEANLGPEIDYAIFSYRKGFLGKKKGNEKILIKLKLSMNPTRLEVHNSHCSII